MFFEDYIYQDIRDLCFKYLDRQTYDLDFRHIEEYKNKINEIYWWSISRHKILSEDFINFFRDEVDWFYISQYKNLSKNFIKKNFSKLLL